MWTAWYVDQASSKRFGYGKVHARTRLVWRESMHERPNWPRYEPGAVRRFQQMVAFGGMHIVENQCLQPVIAHTPAGLLKEPDSAYPCKRHLVLLEQSTFRPQESWQLLELCATESGVQVGQAIVITHFVVPNLPSVGNF